MQLSPQSEKPSGSDFTPTAVVVREQLRRILAHPLFARSKRYPVLLAYTVEQALHGNASELKERTIGVEAFGREPNYDVNLDPVVRTTAAEVRRRLVQYYYNPEHAGELVVELPVGAYIPKFREPMNREMNSPATPSAAREEEASHRDPGLSQSAIADAGQASSGPSRSYWIAFAIALLLVAIAGFGVGRFRVPTKPSNLERFWEPMTATSNRVTYCLGDPAGVANIKHAVPDGKLVNVGFNVSDVTTLARSIVPLVPREGAFRVLPATQTGFTQLREGPFVLIGAFNNPWTMRITQDLPIGFENDDQGRKIVDRKNGKKRYWTLQWQVPNTKLARDYAIVARIHDNVTGQPVIILAGILGGGTEAASEVASNPVYLRAMLENAPRNWDQLNLEAVIETNVIEGDPGPPKVVAVETW